MLLPQILDFACGSGVIAAAILDRAEGDIDLHALDSDPMALKCLKENVPNCQSHLCDGWNGLPEDLRFDLIVSNPPVHNGLASDFGVLRELIRNSINRLSQHGVVVVVCQLYVPVRAVVASVWVDCDVSVLGSDGKFVVWRLGRENESSTLFEVTKSKKKEKRKNEKMKRANKMLRRKRRKRIIRSNRKEGDGTRNIRADGTQAALFLGR